MAQAGTAGTYGTFAIDAAGAWTYTATSAHNEFADGTTYTDTFTVASSDGTTTSVTINITGTNDAPSGADATITAVEDTPRLLTQADFGFTDPDIGDAFSAVTITGVAGGTLYYDADGTGGAGLPVAVGSFPQTYTAAELAAGNVSYRANPNLNGTGVGTISFQVIDDSGAANNSDPSINTLTVDVTAVNDVPVVDLDGNTGGINATGIFLEGSFDPAIGPTIVVTDPDGVIERATITADRSDCGRCDRLQSSLPGRNHGRSVEHRDQLDPGRARPARPLMRPRSARSASPTAATIRPPPAPTPAARSMSWSMTASPTARPRPRRSP